MEILNRLFKRKENIVREVTEVETKEVKGNKNAVFFSDATDLEYEDMLNEKKSWSKYLKLWGM